MEEPEEAAPQAPSCAASLKMQIESSYLSVLSELRRIAEAEQQLGALGGAPGDDEEVQVRVARDAFERAISGLLSRRSKVAQAKAHDVGRDRLDDFEPERFRHDDGDQPGAWEARPKRSPSLHTGSPVDRCTCYERVSICLLPLQEPAPWEQPERILEDDDLEAPPQPDLDDAGCDTWFALNSG